MSFTTASDISDLKIHWDFFPGLRNVHYQKSDIFFLCFLALHVALLIQLFSQARSIHLVPSAYGGRLDDPLGNITLFFVVSVICLAIYVVGALAKFIISVVALIRNMGPYSITISIS
jgi:hypothetical protein